MSNKAKQERFTYPHKRVNHELGNVFSLSIGILLKVKLSNCGLGSFCRQPMTLTNGWTIIGSLDDSNFLLRDLNDWRRWWGGSRCLVVDAFFRGGTLGLEMMDD